MAQVNPKVTSYPVNAKGGAPTIISLTMTCSKVVVMEDPNYNAGNAQGLYGERLDTQPAQAVPQPSPNYQFTWLWPAAGQTGPAFQPIVFGGLHVHGALADYVGAEGTEILAVTSATGMATGVLVEEWT